MATSLTRVERSLIETFVKTNIATTRATAKSRGYILADAAGVADKVTTLLIGNVCSIPVYRSDALADGHNDYFGCDAVEIV
jgi:hypothetical protein